MADAMAAYGGQGGYGIPDYQQAVLDAQSAQYQALIDALRGQRGILDAQYDANAADLYEQYRRTDLALPEMLAGTATGVADSHILENNLNFQNNLEANELARLAAQNDLSAQINQYQAEANLQAAQLAAEYAQQAYQQRMKASGGSGGGGAAQEDSSYTTKMSGPNSSETFGQLMQPGSGYSTGEGIRYNAIVDAQAYYVPGIGRISGAELRRGIESGQINVEMGDNGQYFFRKAG